MNYSFGGTGNAATVTAASAGIIKLENSQAVGAAMSSAEIYDLWVSPFGAAADNNYGFSLKRQSSTGVWTNAGTGNALDPKGSVAGASGWLASSTAGTAGATLLNFGTNFRAGAHIVCVPGGEFCLPLVTGAGIRLEFSFAQSTDLFSANFMFRE